jgi:hypothetical protein
VTSFEGANITFNEEGIIKLVKMSDIAFCFKIATVVQNCFSDAGANLAAIQQAVNKGYDLTSTLSNLNIEISIIQNLYKCLCPDAFQNVLLRFDSLICGPQIGISKDAGMSLINGICLYVHLFCAIFCFHL